jgi:hypothetical protein
VKNYLEHFSLLCRKSLLGLKPQQRGVGIQSFPHGTCGVVTELTGRVLYEMTGEQGAHVCGTGHPDLGAMQSHAWLEVQGYIVDLTHDQFEDTGLHGWVVRDSAWHAKFERAVMPLRITPRAEPLYARDAYLAMKSAASRIWPRPSR